MELTHQFTVPTSVDVAWAAFNDLERIAPCFPGAALTSYDGESFDGLVKIKLGPISLQYTGAGRFVERDEPAHRAVIEAKGKDKRGNGTAAATITASLEASGDDSTDVIVKTELNITGKPAQFGRGVMQDVSDRLLAQFATCLEKKLGTTAADDAAEELAAAEVDPAAAAGAIPDGGGSAAATVAPDEGCAKLRASAPSTDARPPRAVPAQPEHEAAELDLGATVLPILLKRYGPRLIAALVALWLIKKLLHRRS